MFLADTLTNLVSGLGTAKDKTTHGHFHHRLLGRTELDAMYTGDWLSGKIVDAPVDDMTREWRAWSGGPKQVAALEAAERTLRVRQTVNRAMKMARLFGGSAILLGTGDPSPQLPLDYVTVLRGGLQYIHALSRWEIIAGPLNRDPLALHFGAPDYYLLQTAEAGSVQVHPSRVIRFMGQAPLETAYQVDGWGLSTLQRVYDAVRHAGQATGNVAALTHEAKADIISVPDLTRNVLDPAYRANIISRFGLANQAKSLINATLLDASEKWEQRQVSFAMLPEVVRMFLEVVAGAADIPATRLLGIAPKGMNSTGHSDTRNYYDMLSSKQNVDLRPALAPLDEVLIRHALGARPANVGYAFNSLWQMTEAEQSVIALQKAQAAEILATLGCMPPSALRAAIQGMLLSDNAYPGLADALAKAREAGEADAPLILPSQKTEKPSANARPAPT